MIYKLKILDRLLILNMLPTESNVVTMRVIRNIQDNIGFKDEEIKKYNIKTKASDSGGSSVKWDDDSYEVDVDIGDTGISIIKEALETLDKGNKITDGHLDLYEKFML